MADAPFDRIPGTIRDKLEDLKKSLTQELGADLVALIVYGSAARGEYKDGRSDVDLMIVLRAAPREKLEQVSNALQLARYAARVEAMILTADEIPRAADVFPLLYDDIHRTHVMLAGKDPFAELTISNKHRRLRIEQELREAQIRLRRAVVDAQGARDLLVGAVRRKLRQLRGPLHALLTLRGLELPDGLRPVIEQAGKTYEVDVKALFSVQEKPTEAYEALEKLLCAAVDDVDSMDDEGKPRQ